MTTEELYFILSNIEEISTMKLNRLADSFFGPEEIFGADERKLAQLNILSPAEIKALLKAPDDKEKLRKLQSYKEEGINFVYRDHPDFPERLKVIDDSPFSFYYRGRLPDQNEYSVAMVGARACSGYGRWAAGKFAKSLVLEGIQIISGMAHGIDAYSSRAAIEAGGKTFVVLGTGLNRIYPRENTDLYYQILFNGGGVISEYPPETGGTGWHFPHRNRLISGLSDKVLILEARKKSGTLTTAAHALQQGIDIYALPGRIDDPLSEGCNALIADGCGILRNAEDLLADIRSKPVRCSSSAYKSEAFFKKSFAVQKSADQMSDYKKCFTDSADNNRLSASAKNNKSDGLINEETADSNIKKVYQCIKNDPVDIDYIIEKTGLSVKEASASAAELELLGVINEISKDCYIRTFD